jgi:ribose transport system substrate-binding protein
MRQANEAGWSTRGRSLAVSVLVLVTVVAVGCDVTSSGDKSEAGSKKAPYSIALLSQGSTNQFAAQFDAIAKKTAKENKDIKKLTYFDAAGSADKQVPQMENAIAQKPDGIVLVPMGRAALAGPVERAEAKGIPVVLCASGVDTDKHHTLVTRDPYKAGLENAEWLAKTLHGKGNIIIVDGIAGNDTSEQLGKAIRTVLKKNPGIHVVGKGYADFSIAKSKSLANTFINSGKRIDGAWGSGGESVTGIMQAFADSGKKIPPVAGAAAINGALRLAKENHAQVAMFQFPSTMSKGCLDVMVRTLKGEKLPDFMDITKLIPGLENFHTEAVDKYYRPEYTDDYQTGSDKVLDKSDLRSLNLLR